MLLYVAWIAFWEAMFDPRLWTEAASSPAKARRMGVRDHHRGNSES